MQLYAAFLDVAYPKMTMCQMFMITLNILHIQSIYSKNSITSIGLFDSKKTMPTLTLWVSLTVLVTKFHAEITATKTTTDTPRVKVKHKSCIQLYNAAGYNAFHKKLQSVLNDYNVLN